MAGKYHFRAVVVFVALFCGVVCPAYGRVLPRSGVFFYSSECYDAEGGDADGGTFKLTRSAAGDRLDVGGGWEGPMETFPALDVRIAPVRSKNFSAITYAFTIPGDKSRVYTGTISTTAIRIKGVDGKYHAAPRRSMAYKPGTCR